MRKAAQGKTLNVNEVEKEKKCQHDCCREKEHNVKLCETDEIMMNEEIFVHYTDLGKQIMIVDSGSPVSLAGKDWLEQYLKEFDLEIGEMKNTACKQAFCFGPVKRYVSLEMIEVPIVVERTDGKDDVMKVQTYMVDAKAGV